MYLWTNILPICNVSSFFQKPGYNKLAKKNTNFNQIYSFSSTDCARSLKLSFFIQSTQQMAINKTYEVPQTTHTTE